MRFVILGYISSEVRGCCFQGLRDKRRYKFDCCLGINALLFSWMVAFQNEYLIE
jgi:hypothetical protein